MLSSRLTLFPPLEQANTPAATNQQEREEKISKCISKPHPNSPREQAINREKELSLNQITLVQPPVQRSPILEVCSRSPFVGVRTVTLPSYQVTHTATTAAFIDYPFYFPFFNSFFGNDRARTREFTTWKKGRIISEM